MVAQLRELADLVGSQRDVRMKPAHERISGNTELGTRLESLENDFQMQVHEFQSRLEDLQGRLTTTIASLEEKTRDAEFANEWLVYLSTEIRQRLADAPSKLAEMSRDVRARRFEFQLD